MTDYYLNRGESIVIDADTTVDDFYYRGGEIKIIPDAEFNLNGKFIFDVQYSDDAVGSIFQALAARVSLEMSANGKFSGFRVYDLYPENKPLFFPCIVFDKMPESEITTNFFGGEWMESADILCELAFKSDKYLDVGGVVMSKKSLAEYYMWQMRQILNDIEYKSEYIKVGGVDINSTVQEPEMPNQKLYGFSLEMSIEFKKPGEAI